MSAWAIEMKSSIKPKVLATVLDIELIKVHSRCRYCLELSSISSDRTTFISLGASITTLTWPFSIWRVIIASPTLKDWPDFLVITKDIANSVLLDCESRYYDKFKLCCKFIGVFDHQSIIFDYFEGHVLVHTAYDSRQARSVSVLKPIWFPCDTQEE